MKTDHINPEFIKTMREKMAERGSLVNLLTDLLHIGKEAAYRRLRGEVPFTLTEAVTISQKMGISLDKWVGNNSENNNQSPLDPTGTYISIVDRYINLLKGPKDDPESVLEVSAGSFPQTLYLNYENLTKFIFFKWTYRQTSPSIQSRFEETIFPTTIQQQEFKKRIQSFQYSCYIWDPHIFPNLITDMKYFAKKHRITERNIRMLKEELYQVLDDLEKITSKSIDHTGKEFRFYISDIHLETTFGYIQKNGLKTSIIQAPALFPILSTEKRMFATIRNRIDTLKKISIPISGNEIMQRRSFFKKQRTIVDTL